MDMATWLRVFTAFGLLAAAAPADAETFPSKTITIVVPAPPGGVTDIIGRALARHFSEAWGHQAIVENKAGGNNQLAAEYIAKSPPDGYTLFVGPESTFIMNPSLYRKLNYDPIKDFTPITGLMRINHALVLHPSVPAKNVKELIALAKQKPGELNYGTYGIGSSGHLNMEKFEAETGTKMQPVHYKGAAPALNDVIAGHIQLCFVSVGSAVPQWKGGKVNFIAVGSPKRMALLPEIPTIAESGVPGFEAISWFGLYGPAGMPPDVVAKINGEVRKLFDSPDFKKNVLDTQYFESIVGTPQQLSDYMRSEEPKWRKVIHDAKITPIE